MPAYQLYNTTSEMSVREMNELATGIHNHAVQKHLLNLGRWRIKDLATAKRKENETAEAFLERVAHVQGQLAAIEMLLDIEAPTAPV